MRKYLLLLLSTISIGLFSFSSTCQTITPNLGLTLPVQGSPNWGAIVNNDFTIIDSFSASVASFPSTHGVVVNLTKATSRNATFLDIVGLWNSCTSGFLSFDGTCGNSGSGLSGFTSGSLVPLFTTTLGLSPTTNPDLEFTLSPAPSFSVFGNFSNSNSIPSFSNAPTFSAINLINFPTLNQNTTGNAATANALLNAPSTCSISGQFAKGVDAHGNALGCSIPASSSGLTSVGLAVPAWLNVTGSPLTSNGTITISSAPALTANYFIAAPDGTNGALSARQIVPGDITNALVSPPPVGATTPNTGSFSTLKAGGQFVCEVNGTNCPTTYSLGGSLSGSNIVLGPGAGTGASISVVGLDGNHQIFITTGTSPASNGVLFTVTFTATRGHVCYPAVISNNAAGSSPAVNVSTNTATVYAVSAVGTIAASTSYGFNVVAP